jgi:serine/threonine-protein kinase
MVADFGIALAVRAAGGERLTETGLSLGTPHYMSPEQAAGDREVDGRSDLYSLGCVLYEMLAGDPPHAGSTVQAVISSTLSEDPKPITQARRTVPPQVASALHHALEKVPGDRFDTAHQLAEALGSRAEGMVPSVPLVSSNRVRILPLVPWLTVAALAVALAVQLLPRSGGPARPGAEQPLITSISPPPGHRFLSKVSFALSPDGTRLAFAAVSAEGRRRLWIRPLDTLYASPLVEVDGEAWPFFSPDGGSLGFFSHGYVRTLDIHGGAGGVLCEATGFRGGAWGSGDVIVFAAEGGIFRTTTSGGECELLIPDTLSPTGGRPSFLPDGNRFLHTDPFNRTLEVGDLRSGDNQVVASWDPILSGGSPFTWAQSAGQGYLVFGAHQSGSSGEEDPFLMAARMDPNDGSILGNPVEIVSTVRASAGIHSYSVSNTGLLAYMPKQPDLSPVAFHRDGARLPNQIEGIPSRWTFAVSPATQRLFLGGDTDIWSYDPASDGEAKLFTGQGSSPVPGPGDTLVAYLYWHLQEGCEIRLFDVNQDEDRGLFSGPCLSITDWSNDGQHLLLENAFDWLPDPLPNTRIWRYSFADDSLYSFVVRDGDTRDGEFSPDGRWVAFSSDVTGTPEIYIRRFESRDPGIRISRSGGRWPRWHEDGRELYFLAPNGGVYAADLTPVLSGQAQGAPEPRLLFLDPAGQNVSFLDNGTGFGASPDGETFFLRPRTEDQNIALVQNWPALMDRR